MLLVPTVAPRVKLRGCYHRSIISESLWVVETTLTKTQIWLRYSSGSKYWKKPTVKTIQGEFYVDVGSRTPIVPPHSFTITIGQTGTLHRTFITYQQHTLHRFQRHRIHCNLPDRPISERLHQDLSQGPSPNHGYTCTSVLLPNLKHTTAKFCICGPL